MKSQYDSIAKQYADLEDAKNEEIANVNDNPWYSEGKRLAEVKKIETRYENKEKTLTDKLNLYQKLYDTGKSDAQFIASKALEITHQGQVLDQQLVLKQMDVAERAAKLDTQVVEVGGRKKLIDTKTGETISDLGSATGAGGEFTSSQSNRGAAIAGMTLSEFQALDEDTKNFYINDPNADEGIKMVNEMLAGGSSLENIHEEIDNSNLSTTAKTALKAYATSSFTAPQGLVEQVKYFFSNLF